MRSETWTTLQLPASSLATPLSAPPVPSLVHERPDNEAASVLRSVAVSAVPNLAEACVKIHGLAHARRQQQQLEVCIGNVRCRPSASPRASAACLPPDAHHAFSIRLPLVLKRPPRRSEADRRRSRLDVPDEALPFSPLLGDSHASTSTQHRRLSGLPLPTAAWRHLTDPARPLPRPIWLSAVRLSQPRAASGDSSALASRLVAAASIAPPAPSPALAARPPPPTPSALVHRDALAMPRSSPRCYTSPSIAHDARHLSSIRRLRRSCTLTLDVHKGPFRSRPRSMPFRDPPAHRKYLRLSFASRAASLTSLLLSRPPGPPLRRAVLLCDFLCAPPHARRAGLLHRVCDSHPGLPGTCMQLRQATLRFLFHWPSGATHRELSSLRARYSPCNFTLISLASTALKSGPSTSQVFPLHLIRSLTLSLSAARN